MNAYKKPLLRPGGCLEPLLWPCGGFCLRAWRLLGLLGYRLPAKLGVLHAGVARVGLVGVPFPCGAGRTCRGFGAFGTFEAGVARVGLVGVPFACGAGRTFGGFGAFGAFEACQTAAWNAYKKPLLRPGGCLEPLLWPCGGFCLRAWRLLGLLGYRLPAKLGVLHAAPQSLVEAAARKLPRGARGMDALTTERYAGKRPARHFKRFKGLKPVKRQP